MNKTVIHSRFHKCLYNVTTKMRHGVLYYAYWVYLRFGVHLYCTPRKAPRLQNLQPPVIWTPSFLVVLVRGYPTCE